MSERLSGERLSAMQNAARESRVYSLAGSDAVNIITELRERRSQDLTSEDVEALRFARAALMDDAVNDDGDRFEARYAAAFAVLDRLITRMAGP